MTEVHPDLTQRVPLAAFIQRDRSERVVTAFVDPPALPEIQPMRDQEAKAQWIAKLRGTEYVQGTGFLRIHNDPSAGGKDSFCCWGVWCEVKGIPFTYGDDSDGRQTVAYYQFPDGEDDPNQSTMPSMEWLEQEGITSDVANALASANDGGYEFEEIAQWIEDNL